MILILSIALILLGISIIETDPLLGAGLVIIGLFCLGVVGVPKNKRR